jgi:hypothetical protein
MRLRGTVALVVFAAVALGGCGSAGSSEPVTAPPPSIGSTADASAGSSAAATPSMRPADPSGVVMVIHGTVTDGVEPGCVLLTTDSKAYLLIGGDRTALKSGTKLTVHGVPQPDLMTTCQQGTPFRVTKIEP